MVHGNSQGLMRFFRDGAVGHGPGLKTRDNPFLALHLFKGNAVFRTDKFQQVPEISRLLLIHHIRILLKLFVVPLACCTLEHMDRAGIISVVLTLTSLLMAPQRCQFQINRKSKRVKRPAVLLIAGPADILQSDASHRAYGAGKIRADHFVRNADRFKDLASLIRLDRGDPHLGGNLDNAG